MATVWIDDALRDEPGGPVAHVHVRRGSWYRVGKVLGTIIRPGARVIAEATGRSPEAELVWVDGQIVTVAADGTHTTNLADMADLHEGQ